MKSFGCLQRGAGACCDLCRTCLLLFLAEVASTVAGGLVSDGKKKQGCPTDNVWTCYVNPVRASSCTCQATSVFSALALQVRCHAVPFHAVGHGLELPIVRFLARFCYLANGYKYCMPKLTFPLHLWW